MHVTSPTAQKSTVTVEEVADISAPSLATAEWRALADRGPRTELFHTWEWVSAALEAFADDQPVAVHFVRREGVLIGVFPLSGRSARPWQCHGELRYPGPWTGTLYADNVATCLAALGQHLTQHRAHGCLYLPRLHRESSLLQAWQAFADATSRSMIQSPAAPTCVIRLDGGWDAYLGTRSTKVRKEWRRKERKLGEAGTVQIVVYTTPDNCERAVADFMAIERRSWKEDVGRSLAAQREMTTFHTLLAQRCAARGWLRLHVLYLDSVPIAHFYSILFRGQCFALATSYDSRFSHLSPGIVLVTAAIRHAAEEGATLVDLLGAEQRWKHEMTDEIVECVDLELVDPHCLPCNSARLWKTRFKPYVRRNFPRAFAWQKRVRDAAPGAWLSIRRDLTGMFRRRTEASGHSAAEPSAAVSGNTDKSETQ